MIRINWFSPLLPARTDVAHFTTRIAKALMDKFDVVFWTDLQIDSHSLPEGAVVKHYDGSSMQQRDFHRVLFEGVCVYNFGNDARFHTGIADVAQKVPGLAIMHDTRLHHFAFEKARRDTPPFRSYIEMARHIYGSSGVMTARNVIESDGRHIDLHVESMPFIEKILDGALAAISHSVAAKDEIQRLSETPVAFLPLPYSAIENTGRKRERMWRPPWQFIIYGYLNQNRRLDAVLEALANWSEVPDYHLHIYGTIWSDRLIIEKIHALGLASRITVHGFVAEPVLEKAIASAHLAFNLRYPTMGEASGAILRSWSHATPTLVTDAGWYASLSEEVVAKVSMSSEIRDIRAHVTSLTRNASQFKKMGENAYLLLIATHAPEVYVAGLHTLLGKVSLLSDRYAARQMLLRVASKARTEEERHFLLLAAVENISSIFT